LLVRSLSHNGAPVDELNAMTAGATRTPFVSGLAVTKTTPPPGLNATDLLLAWSSVAVQVLVVAAAEGDTKERHKRITRRADALVDQSARNGVSTRAILLLSAIGESSLRELLTRAPRGHYNGRNASLGAQLDALHEWTCRGHRLRSGEEAVSGVSC
jgi:hypothetical protein